VILKASVTVKAVVTGAGAIVAGAGAALFAKFRKVKLLAVFVLAVRFVVLKPLNATVMVVSLKI
jgi:hypothetical protein